MRSANSHQTIVRVGLLAVCCLLLAGSVSGCTTTQETAAKKQVESKRFLEQREAKRTATKKARAKGKKHE